MAATSGKDTTTNRDVLGRLADQRGAASWNVGNSRRLATKRSFPVIAAQKTVVWTG